MNLYFLPVCCEVAELLAAQSKGLLSIKKLRCFGAAILPDKYVAGKLSIGLVAINSVFIADICRTIIKNDTSEQI